MNIQERYRGSILGLGVGDALGAVYEFKLPGTFHATDMVDGGPYCFHKDHKAGQWTDDTSMALCLAASLTEKKGFDAADQMHRFLKWAHEGYMNCKGPFPPSDIGGTVRKALSKYGTSSFNPYCGSTDPNKAGNGSLMRLAPVPLFFANDPKMALVKSAESSLTTHATTSCVDACRYFGGLIVGAVNGVSKEDLLKPFYTPVTGSWQEEPLTQEIHQIASGEYISKPISQISGTGHVVKTLEAALWCFANTDSYKDGVLASVNLGNDSDTTGAVYGQLAGAYYGEGAIPSGWLAKLQKKELLISLAEALIPKQVEQAPRSLAEG